MKPRLRRAANIAALLTIVAYVLSASSEVLALSTHGETPEIPTSALALAALRCSVGGLLGAVAYALVQARRRSRLAPLGAVLGGALGVVAVGIIGALVDGALSRMGNEGEGLGFMMVIFWIAVSELAFELTVVLLVLWGMAAGAAWIRGHRGHDQDAGVNA